MLNRLGAGGNVTDSTARVVNRKQLEVLSRPVALEVLHVFITLGFGQFSCYRACSTRRYARTIHQTWIQCDSSAP
jgi:hypothetical protein